MTHLIDRIASLLHDGRRMTVKQIAQAFDTHISHTRETVKKLHRARQIHICGWVRTCARGAYTPIYMWGDAFDADAPITYCDEAPVKPETQSYTTISKLRTSFVPGQFDPFRVLRAQVSQ